MQDMLKRIYYSDKMHPVDMLHPEGYLSSLGNPSNIVGHSNIINKMVKGTPDQICVKCALCHDGECRGIHGSCDYAECEPEQMRYSTMEKLTGNGHPYASRVLRDIF